MTPTDLCWLAGLLEGEGSFYVGGTKRYKDSIYRFPHVALNMTDADVVNRAATLVGSPKVHRIKHLGAKDTFQWRLAGGRAVALMLELYPLMGERRKSKIQEILTEVGADYIGKMVRLGRVVLAERA